MQWIIPSSIVGDLFLLSGDRCVDHCGVHTYLHTPFSVGSISRNKSSSRPSGVLAMREFIAGALTCFRSVEFHELHSPSGNRQTSCAPKRSGANDAQTRRHHLRSRPHAGERGPLALSGSASALVGPRHSIIASTLFAHAPIFSVGEPDPTEPSGEAPPTTSAIPGYQLRNVTDFDSGTLPANWFIFSGTASGDSGSQWATNHVTVSNGMLQLNTFQDPSFNNDWVSGGICQCNKSYTYGAFFVRSRMTGPGPTQVEMLWPVSGWPPEIDFNETYGGSSSSQATLHYTSANISLHRNISIDMTKWHTWGIVWTPVSIQYTVDGRVWGSITDPAIIPHQPMSLHFQQQTWCAFELRLSHGT